MKITAIYFLLLGSLIIAGIHCGTRHRTADLDLSKDAVEMKLSSLVTTVNNSTIPAEVAMKPSLKKFTDMHQEATSFMYYAEAPGSMGPVDLVMPLRHNQFFSNSPSPIIEGSISKMHIFFVITQRANGVRGSLIIAGNDGQAIPRGTPTPAPTGTPNPTATPSATPGSSGPIEFSFLRIGVNDEGTLVPGRNIALNPGAYSDLDFAMELNMRDESAIIVRSDDIVSDDESTDLADVIKLKLSRLVNSQEIPLGQVILAQPE